MDIFQLNYFYATPLAKEGAWKFEPVSGNVFLTAQECLDFAAKRFKDFEIFDYEKMLSPQLGKIYVMPVILTVGD